MQTFHQCVGVDAFSSYRWGFSGVQGRTWQLIKSFPHRKHSGQSLNHVCLLQISFLVTAAITWRESHMSEGRDSYVSKSYQWTIWGFSLALQSLEQSGGRADAVGWWEWKLGFLLLPLPSQIVNWRPSVSKQKPSSVGCTKMGLCPHLHFWSIIQSHLICSFSPLCWFLFALYRHCCHLILLNFQWKIRFSSSQCPLDHLSLQ